MVGELSLDLALANISSHIIRKAPSISNIHIRIYSIFGELNAFVYAEDLSTNGSYWLYKKNSLWHQSRIGKGNAVLLSDGDQVQLCDGSCYVFYALINSTPPPIKQDASCTQEKEIEVCHILNRSVSISPFTVVHEHVSNHRSTTRRWRVRTSSPSHRFIFSATDGVQNGSIERFIGYMGRSEEVCKWALA